MWLWGCLAPHPPIIVPAVGRGRENEASGTLRGMERLAGRLKENRPDVLFILSPHAPFGDGLMFVDAKKFEGGLQQFGVREKLLEAQGKPGLTRILADYLAPSIPSYSWATDTFPLDHASVVPLTWLSSAWGTLPPLILANPIGLSLQRSHELGKKLPGFEDSRKWALLASGDLSHRVTPGAPAGYHPDGARFDAIVMNAIAKNDASSLLELDPDFIDRAGECGLRSVLALLGLAGDDPIEVFSYEAPFGVGYGTALWENKTREGHEPQIGLPALAREAITRFLKKGNRLSAPEAKELFPGGDVWQEKRACFVSLKNRRDGSLRGCIGTLEPTCPSLGEEVLQNAVSSATRDPRFEPLTLRELPGVAISVDVLSEPEAIPGPEYLDPRKYGVIVEKGDRRGVLLPDLEGVETVEQQLNIASRKAGLRGPEEATLRRFTVHRHTEGDGK